MIAQEMQLRNATLACASAAYAASANGSRRREASKIRGRDAAWRVSLAAYRVHIDVTTAMAAWFAAAVSRFITPRPLHRTI
jgi:hypothetical protein